MKVLKCLLCALLAGTGLFAGAGELKIKSFSGDGKLAYRTLNDGTNYNYRVEWSASLDGPWNEFGSSGAHGLNAKPQSVDTDVTNMVPMFYRVVATLGDYMCVDIAGGTNAASYPVTYYRTQADVPDGANSDIYKADKILLKMIPKGTCMMGYRATDYPGATDSSLHSVTLTKDFYIGVFEVTQRQWELVMGNKPSYFNNASYYATRPVEQVSYYDIRESPANSAISPNWPASSQVHANSFMGKLRAKTGLSTFDLPTESQWEYACRAGTTTALNTGYNLTNTSSEPRVDVAGRYWYNGGSGYTQNGDTGVATAKAGTYLPNAWGLYDMHGNVWEWCLDWDGTSYRGPVTDPLGAASGADRLERGGSWGSGGGDTCRSGSRYAHTPSHRYISIGFRVSRTLP
jgi:formylglycine-generating enzyme required for sulfatase activity